MLLGDARDPDRYLRVTWHPDSETVVFSHWHGGVCAASTPVRLSEVSQLADFLDTALRSPGWRSPGWRSPAGAAASGAHESGE